MGLAVQLERSSNGSKVIHLNLKVVKEVSSSQLEANDTTRPMSTAQFLQDFEAVVCKEVQKSLDCIMLIKQDMNHYRTESQMLRKQLQLESSPSECARIKQRIAANKEWLAECEEQIALVQQRAVVLQEQLRKLFSQAEQTGEAF